MQMMYTTLHRMFTFQAGPRYTDYHEFYFHSYKNTKAIASQNTRARINLQTLKPLTLNGTKNEYTDSV
jgi:hypothetical protein